MSASTQLTVHSLAVRAVLVPMRLPLQTSSGTIPMPSAAAACGSMSDAESVKIATRRTRAPPWLAPPVWVAEFPA